jgi:hypothetical protein
MLVASEILRDVLLPDGDHPNSDPLPGLASGSIQTILEHIEVQAGRDTTPCSLLFRLQLLREATDAMSRTFGFYQDSLLRALRASLPLPVTPDPRKGPASGDTCFDSRTNG